MNDKENRLIIDEYGNILDEFTTEDRLSIKRKSSMDAYKKIKKYEKMEVFIMNDPIKKAKYLYNNLTNTELGFLDRIVNNLQYNNCILMKDKYIPIRTIKEFVEIGKMSKQSVVTLLKKLVELKVIYKTNKRIYNYYFINPYVYFKGNNINEALQYAYDNHDIDIERI